MKSVNRVALIKALILLALASSQVEAQEKTLTEIAESGRGSTIFLTVKHADPSNPDNVCSEINQGSAFFISSDGYALTAGHNFQQLEDCQGFTQLQIEGQIGSPQSSYLRAELLSKDEAFDTAIIKFSQREEDYSTVSFCRQQNPVIGEKLAALGFPRGSYLTPLSVGFSNSNGPFGKWAVSGDLTHGMSGGPVYNLQGNVIGLIQGGLSNTDAVRYVTPLAHASNMIDLSGQDLLNCTDVNNDPATLAGKIRALESEIEVLKAQIDQLKNQPQVHSLVGYVTLSDLEESERKLSIPGGFEETGRIPVKFAIPFTVVPDVIVSPTHSDIYGILQGKPGTHTIHFDVAVHDLTTEGFTITISGAYIRSFSDFGVRWLAVGRR